MTLSDIEIFKPVSGTNKSQSIAFQIETAINQGLFEPGSRLPSERKLQKLFASSRGAVREALRELRQKGLVQAKKGATGGYFIKEVDINETIDRLAFMIQRQQVPVGKLLEFQYAMDHAVLVSAITNADDQQVQRLSDLADELLILCSDGDPDFERITTVDKGLNLLMVEMTGNPFFEWMMRSIQLTFRAYEFVVYEDPNTRKQIAQNWKKTSLAVRSRDVQKALRLYGHWYILLEQCLQERFKDMLDQTTVSEFFDETEGQRSEE